MRAIIGFTFLFLCVCTRRPLDPKVAEDYRNRWREFNKTAASLSAADGIDLSEAEFLARSFFDTKISGCGYPDTPEDAGAYWRSRPMIGYGGRPSSELILINKRTGAVSYASLPPVVAQSVIEDARESLRDDLRPYDGD